MIRSAHCAWQQKRPRMADLHPYSLSYKVPMTRWPERRCGKEPHELEFVTVSHPAWHDVRGGRVVAFPVPRRLRADHAALPAFPPRARLPEWSGGDDRRARDVLRGHPTRCRHLAHSATP